MLIHWLCMQHSTEVFPVQLFVLVLTRELFRVSSEFHYMLKRIACSNEQFKLVIDVFSS